jgi:CDP-diacylglycerol--serine O-phosphatidyltransferase
LPTPASTLFFLTIPLIWINEKPEDWIYQLTISKPILIGLTILFSFFLIAEFPLLALKFKGFSLKENVYRYLFLIISLFGLLTLKHLSIPLILMLYILISLIENKRKKITKKKNYPLNYSNYL